MRKRSWRALSVENLENRRLLAGNVTVTRSGADLIITGDNLSNTISIESNGSGGVRVSGFNDATLQPTSINGTPNGTFQSPSFSGSVIVNMNDGDDTVRLTRLQLQTASINLGAGNDALVAGLQAAGENRFGATTAARLLAQGSFNVIGGDGADNIRLQSVYVAGSSVIDTGNQNDTITLLPGVDGGTLDNTAQRIDIGGTLTIVPGGGNDVISAKAVITGSNFVIDDSTGGLTAELRSFRSNGSTFIYGTPEIDDIKIVDGRAVALMQIIAEDGNDHVEILNTYANNLNINMGDGADRLSLDNVRGPRADIQLGVGNDRFATRNLNIDTLFAFGNAGDDLFDIRSSRIRQANFYGEGGFDTFQDSAAAPNTIGTLNLFTIERRRTV